MRRITNKAKRILNVLLIFTVIMTAAVCLMPEEASAADATILLGGEDISSYNDNTWHSGAPIIHGCESGTFKLSTDRSTLYLRDFSYSGVGTGISSSEDLTVVASGTNTFSCAYNRGIELGELSGMSRDITFAGELGSKLNFNSTGLNSIYVNTCTIVSGTVNATGKVHCQGDYTGNDGTMIITGDLHVDGNMTISGGTLSSTGHILVSKNANISDGNVKTDLNIYVVGTFTQSGGRTESGDDIDSQSVFTIEGGYLDSSGSIIGQSDIIASGGLARAKKMVYCGGNLTVAGTDIVALTKGVLIYGELSIEKGDLIGTNTTDPYASGVYVKGNSTVMGTGRVISSAENQIAFHTRGKLTVKAC